MTKKNAIAIESKPADVAATIAKFEAKFAAKGKHMTAYDVGVNYLFPLLRSLAHSQNEQGAQIEALVEFAENIEGGEEFDDVELLEDARQIIGKLAGLLDQTMVAAGFYTFDEKMKQMHPTDKAPKDLLLAHQKIAPEVIEVVGDLNDAIEELDDDADEDPADGVPDGTEAGADNDDDSDDTDTEGTSPVAVVAAAANDTTGGSTVDGGADADRA